ncbi:hypothetical protein D5F01_LYC24266 [Larimichthys crocea]|uniref:Uncharacterized protein n=1 Tax=Larimichthys crocea TaxID=215358 RepID=A0A6G0HEW2_LARCR|nr:hypothetical protein D5F01_LYC24266 [Larimichthys crocea]
MDSFPGAHFRHAQALMEKTAAPQDLVVEKIILSFGINGRENKCKETTVKNLQGAIRSAKRKFPYADVLVPMVNYSPVLPEDEKDNLDMLNDHLEKNMAHIPLLPERSFQTFENGSRLDRGALWTKTSAARPPQWDRAYGRSVGGRTVHPPSPVGDGRQSPTLIGQCLPQGPPSMPVPDIARTRMLFAKDGLNQPGDGFLHGTEEQRRNLTRITQDAIDHAEDLVTAKQTDAGSTTQAQVPRHTRPRAQVQSQGTQAPVMKTAASPPHLIKPISKLTSSLTGTYLHWKSKDLHETAGGRRGGPRQDFDRGQPASGGVGTARGMSRCVGPHSYPHTHSELEALFDELQAEEEMEAAVSSPQTQRKVRAEGPSGPTAKYG